MVPNTHTLYSREDAPAGKITNDAQSSSGGKNRKENPHKKNEGTATMAGMHTRRSDVSRA